jgi:hypothetical protein
MSDLIPPQWNTPKANSADESLPSNTSVDFWALDFWECMQGICLRPYKTIRMIVNTDPKYGQIQLFALLVLSTALQDLKHGFIGFLQGLLVSVLFWAVSIYPTIAAIWFTGKQLKGKGTYTEISTAFMWAMSPTILGNIVSFAISAFVPELLSGLIAVLFFLFGLKLTIATLAEVQGFTLWESVVNQAYALLLMCIPLVILMIIFWTLIASMAMAALQNLMPGFSPSF